LQFIPALPAFPWVLLLSLLVPVSLWFRGTRLLALAGCGFLWALLFAALALSQELEPDLEGRDLLVEGAVASLPQQRGDVVQFEFDVDQLWVDGLSRMSLGPIRLNWYHCPHAVRANQVWRLTVRLKRRYGFMNPGGFDYEGWLFRQGIAATGYVRHDTGNRLLEEGAGGYPLQRIRQSLRDAVQVSLADSPYRGIVTALAIGESGAITPQQWAVLFDSGTNHLVAISGLQISLVAGLIFFCVRRLWSLSAWLVTSLPAPQAAAWAALLAATGYALLAGFSVPTQRALIMVAVVMGAILLRRAVFPSQTLALALLLVLLLDPLSVLAPGFWLSFAAVGVILYSMIGRFKGKGLWWTWGRLQWLIALGLLPITLLWFQRALLLAPLANLVAVPWTNFGVVPVALLGTLLIPFSAPLGDVLLKLADTSLNLLWPWLEWVARQPVNVWSQHTPPVWTALPGLLGVLLLLAPRGFPARWLGVIFLLPLFVLRPTEPPPGGVWFTLLDVGQGLSAIIRTRHHVLVYDTGPRFTPYFEAGSAVLLPFLYESGIRRVDTLVVSHGDNDHSGGADTLLKRFAVGNVLTSVPNKITWQPTERCVAGQAWIWDGVRFEVLHPSVDTVGNDNDRSCVVRVASSGGSILLPGDIEAAGERTLLRYRKRDLPADILVAPHHGSTTSSTVAFVNAVRPKYVLYSVGYRNRFKFPQLQVVERYERIGTERFDTASHGAITIRISPQDGISTPESYRALARRYWTAR
jgi:DNA internalization-related competence protein ComEC/Rec2